MSRRPRTSTIGWPARRAAKTSALCAGVLGVVAAVGMLPSAQASHLTAGPLTVLNTDFVTPLTSGDSSTPFIFKLPDFSTCTGDSTTGGYRVQSFLVPESVELDTLRFDSEGPVQVAGQFRAPFFQASDGRPFINEVTATANPSPGPGGILQPIPTFDFMVFVPAGTLPAGVYTVGIACSVGSNDLFELDKYWSTKMTITADPADPGPADIRFVVAATDPTTTSTTQPGGSTTSTTQPGGSTSTSTTQPGGSTSTSTTLPGGSTSTSTTQPGGSTTSTRGTSGSADDSGGASGAGGARGSLPRSGSGPLSLVLWSFILICLGRAVILLARRRSRLSDER